MSNRVDLTGQRFGKLIADEYIGHGKYRCICDCGNQKIVPTGKLNAGEVKSCGCLKNWNLVGKRFGRLTVIEKAESYNTPSKGNIARYLCQCDCGNIKNVRASSLKSGRTKSCGCLEEESITGILLKDSH